jgi:hypothetical protein
MVREVSADGLVRADSPRVRCERYVIRGAVLEVRVAFLDGQRIVFPRLCRLPRSFAS